MELNVKNCLGPSVESIPIAYEMQLKWYDDHVHVVDTSMGYGGADTHVILYRGRTKDEAEWVERRITQLEDLMDLRSKLPWAESMYARSCPCGMTNDQWQAYQEYLEWGDDPMGDYMGKNE